MRIPSDNQWKQTNRGDIFGVLNATRNVNFDYDGYLTLSKRPIAYYSSADNADFGYLCAILYFNSTYYFVTEDSVFSGEFSGSALTERDGHVGLSLGTDAVVWNSRLYVSGNTAIDYTSDGSTWNGTIGVTLTSTKHHPLCVFESQNQLAVGNLNTVKTYNTSHSLIQTLTLPANYEVTSIRYRNSYLYIGTKEMNGGEAKLFIWDGAGSSAQYAISCGSNWIFSMCEYGESVAVVTNLGQLLILSGNELVELANFPIYSYPDKIWQTSNGFAIGGKVFNRGMVADGKLIYIVIDGSNAGDQVSEQISGLWCYDPAVGLYHKSLTNSDEKLALTESSIDTSADTITFNAALDAETGDPILITNVGSVTGLTNSETYYIIKESSTTIGFARTRYDALNDHKIDLGGSLGSFAATANPLESIGELYDVNQGAVAVASPLTLPETIWESGVIWGGRSNSIYTVNTFSLSNNVGSFTTQKVYSENIKDAWNKLITFLSTLNFENEKVVVKYKTSERLSTPSQTISASWFDASHLQSTDTNSWNTIEVGDEITITSGTGCGYTAHVTEINQLGDLTWIMALDESIGVTSDTCTFTADNFKKINLSGSDSENSGDGFISSTIDTTSSTWVQFRIELRGYEIRIPFLELANSVYKPVN